MHPCHCGVDGQANDPQLLETLDPEHEQHARLVSAVLPAPTCFFSSSR
jgi:hypothetical protein